MATLSAWQPKGCILTRWLTQHGLSMMKTQTKVIECDWTNLNNMRVHQCEWKCRKDIFFYIWRHRFSRHKHLIGESKASCSRKTLFIIGFQEKTRHLPRENKGSSSRWRHAFEETPSFQTTHCQSTPRTWNLHVAQYLSSLKFLMRCGQYPIDLRGK